jgi:hypothetical protein
MAYYSDDHRHLICVPYSIEELHKMAEKLGIKRCWFHKTKFPHYDIPHKKKDEIKKNTLYMTSKQIILTIKKYK